MLIKMGDVVPRLQIPVGFQVFERVETRVVLSVASSIAKRNAENDGEKTREKAAMGNNDDRLLRFRITRCNRGEHSSASVVSFLRTFTLGNEIHIAGAFERGQLLRIFLA